MPFEFRKISDVGSNHPVVARLAAQTAEVLKWMNVEKGAKDAIGALHVHKLTSRLLRCHKIRDDLVAKVKEGLREHGPHDKARSRNAPHVIGLQEAVEDFLYQAKNYLRDLLILFETVYGCPLKEASAFADLKAKGDSDLLKWALATLGPDHAISELLKTEQEWVGQLVRMRNAVEHRDGYSGELTVLNIRVFPEGYIPPTWQLTGGSESSIIHDMDTELHNMLTLVDGI